uniref:Uncharacterized protein n=1 Tax=Arundo donax TaxID=35708 RepID=A0A0A8ZEN0_ARUDO
MQLPLLFLAVRRVAASPVTMKTTVHATGLSGKEAARIREGRRRSLEDSSWDGGGNGAEETGIQPMEVAMARSWEGHGADGEEVAGGP